ncbi:MAG: right-handed parallel beta-helix repeat-containing protein [Candidatus Brocadiae bacterium]|nr:right-handed parallel beta-helix repeat-containing protein [Candidatus Brocadiia bacterium]
MRLPCTLAALAFLVLAIGCVPPPPDIDRMPEAGLREQSDERVRDVLIGKIKVANAAWWGFDAEDSTAAIQGAIDSRAPAVLIPNMGKDWIVSQTIRLRSNQRVLLQRGAVVAAMKGKFLGRGEALFLAENRQNVYLYGYGATLRMRKADYTEPPYQKAEWRHALSLRGCTRVQVHGLTLAESGGDGIYIGTTKEHRACRQVLIKDVTCDGNHRQGISVISADGLLIDSCRLLNTKGTAPQAGIDLEPNRPNEHLANVVIRNCVVEGNAGPGIYAYLAHLDRTSWPLSVRVEDCTVRACGSFGIGGGALGDDGPRGYITFSDVRVEGTHGPGAYVYDKSADRARFRFVRCKWSNVARRHGNPIAIALRGPKMTQKPGGLYFAACRVEDDRDRPFLVFSSKVAEAALADVRGTLAVKNPNGARMDLGARQERCRIRIADYEPASE